MCRGEGGDGLIICRGEDGEGIGGILAIAGFLSGSKTTMTLTSTTVGLSDGDGHCEDVS